MSNFIYIASDSPLQAKANPHERLMSVNQALALGVQDIPDFFLTDSFDKDKPDVIMVSDRTVNFNTDTGLIEDGDFDDDFNIWIPDNSLKLVSNKKYFAVLQWHKLTEGRAENIIKYIAEALKNTDEIELWHIWLGAESEYHKLKIQRLAFDKLKPEDIIQLEKRKMWGDMLTDDIEIIYDYCYVITK